MTSMQNKPTVEQILKRKVAGHSHQRVIWETAKKAAAKQIDTKVFNQNLGPALDNLHSLIKGAEEVKRYYAKLDDRTLKPVKEARSKVVRIAEAYAKLCDQKAKDPKLSADVRRAWNILGGSATGIATQAQLATKGLL